MMKKFAFEIRQILEISNVFYRIMYNPQDTKNALLAVSNPLGVILVKYPNKVQEIGQRIFNRSLKELKI